MSMTDKGKNSEEANQQAEASRNGEEEEKQSTTLTGVGKPSEAQSGDLFGDIEEKIKTILNTKRLNNIEVSMARNIEGDLSAVKVLQVYCTPKYFQDHVEKKVECVGKELDIILKGKEEEKEKVEMKKSIKIKTSERLNGIANRTKKIRNLVSQFGTLPEEDEEAEAGAASRSASAGELKMQMDRRFMLDLCVEESVLISPMMDSLRKSYVHLSEEQRLCLLCLAPFPENFIVKKRPLIYWWMAEGFIANAQDGQGYFTDLINTGLIQPWREAGNTNQASVQGCTVHPWIRRMLVSTAMEAQLFEFYKRRDDAVRWTRLCLYDDDYATGETPVLDATGETPVLDATWVTQTLDVTEKLKWINARLKKIMNYIKDSSTQPQVDELQKDLKKLKEKYAEAKNVGLKQPWLNRLFLEQPWPILDIIEQHLNDLKHHDNRNKILEYLQREIKNVQDRIVYLKPDGRTNNLEFLQSNEELFKQKDLNCRFPFPVKKDTTRENNNNNNESLRDADKILAIINVNQSYLNMSEEWFGKLTRLRALHLGRWRDNLPIHRIEIENQKPQLFLDALFQVSKYLKYLSLRGISRVTELPSSISNCRNLETLDLKACYNLEKLPSSQIGSLYKLAHFDVSECYLLQDNNKLWTNLQKLPSLHTLKGLKVDDAPSSQHVSGMNNKHLTKLSIIFTPHDPTAAIDLSGFTGLRILTITWKMQTTKYQPQSSPETSKDPLQPLEETQEQKGTSQPLEEIQKSKDPSQQESKTSEESKDAQQRSEKSKDEPQQDPLQPLEETQEQKGTSQPLEEIQKSKDPSQQESKNPSQPSRESGEVLPQQGPQGSKVSTSKSEENKKDEGPIVGVSKNLRKLDLRCYPDETWPAWLNKENYPELETLYILGGDIMGIPEDVNIPKPKVLRLKYLKHKDFDESKIRMHQAKPQTPAK